MWAILKGDFSMDKVAIDNPLMGLNIAGRGLGTKLEEKESRSSNGVKLKLEGTLMGVKSRAKGTKSGAQK